MSTRDQQQVKYWPTDKGLAALEGTPAPAMTLQQLHQHLVTIARDYRRQGRDCCAQQAEQYATRLAEAIEQEARP